ncbi:hypothetical protein B0O80DRAFT_140289 [Mortierella sp. GBAus27b]|nr:hypothetical protein B0O80DRAFT_140289 [Mortierella sp. GBAus27b]
MALLGFVVALHSLILITSLAAMGLDFYFVDVYVNNNTVALLWRFCAQAGIVGIWIFFFFISLVVLIVQHRRRRYHPQSPPMPSYMMESSTERASIGHVVSSVIRAMFTLVTAIGMLCITIKAMKNENRSILVLPSPRNSAYGSWGQFDPMDLRHCPSASSTDPLSALCSLDRVVIELAIIAALLVIMEAPLMFMYSNRASTTTTYIHRKRVGTKHMYM